MIFPVVCWIVRGESEAVSSAVIVTIGTGVVLSGGFVGPEAALLVIKLSVDSFGAAVVGEP